MTQIYQPVRALILDMDGVLWRADTPIGDLKAIFEAISQKGFQVTLATNNSTLTAEQFQAKLRTFGAAVDAWQIVTSPETLAATLHKRFPAGGPVYIFGEDGLRAPLLEKGFYHSDESVLAVAMGMDREMNYPKLGKACLLLRGGAPFYATNADVTFPTPHGLYPGTGAFIKMLEVASETSANIVGKPAPEMYQVALERLGTCAAETLVVGDRIETDIIGAQMLGCQTALVLSGVTGERKAREWQPALDYIARDLTALVERL